MTDQELYSNPDHRVWAREFCRLAIEKGFDPMREDDVDWIASWIANAMMHGDDRANPLRVASGALFNEYEQGQMSDAHPAHRALWQRLGHELGRV